MAKIKYSALVSDMRGKLNGSVASKNRFGSYFRNKVTPVNPQSTFQQNARQRFGALSSEFKDLGNALIIAWNDAAKNFPVTNIFGDQVYLTGQMLFNRLNGNLLKLGLPKITTAPEPVSFPELVIPRVTVNAANNVIDLVVESPDPLPAGYAYVVYATRPMPISRNFLKNEYRMLELQLGEFIPAVGEYDLYNSYALRFGDLVVGTKIGFRIALVSTVNGQQSTPLELVQVVSA